MHVGLPLPQQAGGIETVEGHPQALAALTPAQLKAEFPTPLVRQPQELQHLEVEIQQRGPTVQGRGVERRQLPGAGDEIHQGLL